LVEADPHAFAVPKRQGADDCAAARREHDGGQFDVAAVREQQR